MPHAIRQSPTLRTAVPPYPDQRDGHSGEVENNYAPHRSVRVAVCAGTGKPDDVLAAIKDCAAKLAPSEIPAYSQGVRLSDFANPIPEEDNPNALFAGGYLRKGGALTLIAPSGVGKSSLSIQASILWALGSEAFGIKPLRPLKIIIIQAEDDDDDVAHMRNDIKRGLLGCGCSSEDIDTAIERVFIYSLVGLTDQAFCDALDLILQEQLDADLVIVNPLQSYAGCDISSNSELTKFLRTMIDPVIKPNRAALMLIHHTNKPPSAKERKGWGVDALAAYSGAGGAELVNWSRAVLTIMPIEKMVGVYVLCAAKRGTRLKWLDAAGKQTTKRYIAHSEDFIFWRDATDSEISEATGGFASSFPGRRRKSEPAKDVPAVVELLEEAGKPLPSGELLKAVVERCGIGKAAAREVISRGMQDGAIVERVLSGPPRSVLKGTPAQMEVIECEKH